MPVRLLGPIELAGEAGVIPIGAPKRRAVLAILALELNRVVPVQRLLDLVWGDDPPLRARTALQGHVSALRKVLGDGLQLQTRDPGYLLHGDPDLVDVCRFDRLVSRAATEDDAAAADTLGEALSLWRGAALADMTDTDLQHALESRLDEARRAALEARAERLVRLGRGGEALAGLHEELHACPMRESLARALVLCLYQNGRQADALQVYHQTRTCLANELGVIPGPALQAAYQMVLRGEPLPNTVPEPAEAAQAEAEAPDATALPAPAAPHGIPALLPRAVAGFAGRQRELALLDRHCADRGIAVVVGSPGVGKTALVMYWAQLVASRFPDGQLYVDMRDCDAGMHVGPEVALAGFLRALGVPDSGVPSRLEDKVSLYRTLLSGKRVFVVIDDVRSACQVRPLLPTGPDAAVVITSRHRLDGLAAQEGAGIMTLAPLQAGEAIDLLTGVLGADRVAAEPDAARRLVKLCGELPLALRVAAARLVTNPARTLGELVEELADERYRLQGLCTDDGSVRVEAALSLTYQALPAPAAELFRYLGLHPGPHLDVPAVAALAGHTAAETGRQLTTLAVSHLVEEVARDRYGQHALVRLYGAALAADGFTAAERDAAAGRLLDHYLHVTAAVYMALGTVTAPHLPLADVPCGVEVPSGSAQALDWFDANEANLRVVLAFGVRCNQQERVWKLVDNVSVPYSRRGNHTDLRAAVAIGLAAARETGDEYGQMRMLRRLGSTVADLGRAEDAAGHFRAALELADRYADDQQRCAILDRLASCERTVGHWDQALAYYGEALGISRRLGDPRREVIVLNNIADGWIGEGYPDRALEYVAQAMDCYAELSVDSTYVAALHTRGCALERLDRLTEALSSHEEALNVAQWLGDLRAEAPCLESLGGILRRLDRRGEAWMHLRRAAELYTQLGRPEADTVRAQLAGLGSHPMAQQTSAG